MLNKSSVIYQIVTDRFNNENNSLVNKLYSPDYNLKFNSIQGGNLRGIEEKIEYLKDLGITHLLISPVNNCKDYHGYLYEDSFKINPSIGSKEDLKRLIEKLRKQDIGVIMDYVATHVSDNHPLFKTKGLSKKNSDREWFLYIDQMKKNKEYNHYFDGMVYKVTSGNPSKLKEVNSENYLCYFGLKNHPLLNLKNNKVVNFHKSVLNYWLSNFDFDAIRLDSGFLQPRSFIKELNNFIDNRFENKKVFAEYWGFELGTGECYGFCDGEFDINSMLLFSFDFMSPDFFKNIRKNYNKSIDYLTDYDSISSLGNHDIHRFLHRWNDNSLQKIASLLQFTLPQIPLIYYGEELAMRQYNDGSNRIAQSRDIMNWNLLNDSQSLEMKEYYKNLIKFRKNYFPQNNENIKKIPGLSEMKVNDNSNLFTYKLSVDKNNFFILLNKDNKEKVINLHHLFSAPKLDNYDLITGKKVIGPEIGTLLLESKKGYIFKGK